MERIRRALADILGALEEIGAQHALFGGLAAGWHGAERATADVDLLLARASIKHVESSLAWRGYGVRAFSHVTKLYRTGDTASVGDLLAMEANPALRTAFAATEPAVILGLPVSVVKRGAFVALKFEATVTVSRRPRHRARDLADIRAVLAKAFGPEDEGLAAEIAAKMYPGADCDLEALIEDVQGGRPPRVAIRATRRAALLLRQGRAARGARL